jgi:hypothetical protein
MKIYRRTQENATCWARLLGVLEGMLEMQKCSYHVMLWKFTVHGAPVLATCSMEFRALEVANQSYHRRESSHDVSLTSHST